MREDRISWNDHNMLHAIVASMRSPDPNTQVGAYICDTMHKPVATGYNGTPRNIDPESIPWEREGSNPANTKYPYIVHAEKNAIHNANSGTNGAILYVTLFPCHECAKDIVQAGIHKVIYLEDEYADTWSSKVSKEILDMAGVGHKKFKWDRYPCHHLNTYSRATCCQTK